MKAYTRSWFALMVLAVIVVGVFALWPRPARAAGPWYVAPSGNDSNTCLSVGSPCATINGAIGKASSGDTIRVAIGTYTNTTSSEVVSVTKSINLSGGWDGIFATQSSMSTIDGEGVQRGITVNSGMTASVDRLVIQNGSAPNWLGSGIYNAGILALANSTVTSNVPNGFPAGLGIYNTGTMTITNSTISNNLAGYYMTAGGGIVNDTGAILTLNNSAVKGNTSYYGSGGGIYNRGVLSLNNSTLSGNTASGGNGGGIFNNGGTLILNNSTLSGNMANNPGGNTSGGGIYAASGIVSVNNSTLSGNSVGSGIGNSNGGGIYNESSTITLQNTILAGNTASTAGPDCVGAISSSGYNLIGSTSGCAFSVGTGDLLNVDPKLFALTSSLGYLLLLPDSPAIDAGNPVGCTDNLGNPLNADQRGVARVGRCDIGAYEFDPNNNPIKQVFLPLVRATCKPGICGRVTLNGAAAAGVSLELRFFNGASWYTIANTTTNSNGDYTFTGMPGLAPGQRYYVLYRNYANTPGRLWVWGTRALTSYSAGSAVEIGNFDIADIPLISPPAGATVALPYIFQWTRRPATPSDTYEFDIYDPTDGDPYAYTVPPLGYVGNFTMNSLPPGFGPGAQYAWEIWVYSPDGGYGISYETRLVTFSNTGQSVSTASQTLRLEPHDLEDAPKRR